MRREMFWFPDGTYRVATEAEWLEATEAVHRAVKSPHYPVMVEAVGAALPDAVHVLRHQRIGDSQRLHVSEHLDWAFTEGLLNGDEHEARHMFVMDHAQTQEDLDAVIADLPPIPRTRWKAPVPAKKPFDPVSAVLVGVFAGLFWAAAFLELAKSNAVAGAIVFTVTLLLAMTYASWKLVKK
jgi:hypothetical protein